MMWTGGSIRRTSSWVSHFWSWRTFHLLWLSTLDPYPRVPSLQPLLIPYGLLNTAFEFAVVVPLCLLFEYSANTTTPVPQSLQVELRAAPCSCVVQIPDVVNAMFLHQFWVCARRDICYNTETVQ
ncbi:hypothetical protein VTO73DRAFT_345 [Trametes versicolor]